MDECLIYGKKSNGNYYVRPDTWAGAWDGEGLLYGGNVLFESESKQECKDYIRRYNRNYTVRKLADLIRDNPMLEVIPMIEYEVVAGDDFYRWAGSIGESSIKEYLYDSKREEAIVYKAKLSEEQIKQYEEDGYEWCEAIFVNIDLPDYDE